MGGDLFESWRSVALMAILSGNHTLFAEEPIVPIDCGIEIKNEFPVEAPGGGCRDYMMFVQSIDGASYFVDEISCHFQNQISAYAYQSGERYFLDIKGLSGSRILNHASDVNRTETFHDCASLQSRIRDISSWQARRLPQSAPRNFLSRDSVLVVASASDCKTLAPELSDYLSLLHSEQRSQSALLCLDDALVRKKNPADVRRKIRSAAKGVTGIMLVGDDIPPFEYFYRTGWGGEWSPYKWGMTDLPYGSLDDKNRVWVKPLSKISDWINEVVYKSENFVYTTQSPTPFAFDFDAFVEAELKNDSRLYTQSRWVSRFLASDASLKSDFRRFVERRKSSLPSTLLNVARYQGSNGFMLRPGEHNLYDYFASEWMPWIKSFSSVSSLELMHEVDLDQSLRFLDQNITHLILSEHGHPQAIGNILGDSLTSDVKLPPFVSYDSCLTGAWGYADSVEASLVSKTFALPQAPLVLIASQGVKSLSTFGPPSSDVADPLISQFVPGETIGSRQIDSFHKSLEGWRISDPYVGVKGELPGNLFHSLAIFGDGTWEF